MLQLQSIINTSHQSVTRLFEQLSKFEQKNNEKIKQIAIPVIIVLGIILASVSYVAVGFIFPIASAIIYPTAMLASVLYITKNHVNLRMCLNQIMHQSADPTRFVEDLQTISRHLDRMKLLSFLAVISLYSPPVIGAIAVSPPLGLASLAIVITAGIAHLVSSVKLSDTETHFTQFTKPLLYSTYSTNLDEVVLSLSETSELKRQNPDLYNKGPLLKKLLSNERANRQIKEAYFESVKKNIQAGCENIFKIDPKDFSKIEEVDYSILLKIYLQATFKEAESEPFPMRNQPPTLIKRLADIGAVRSELRLFNSTQKDQLKIKLLDFESPIPDTQVTKVAKQISVIAHTTLQSSIISNNPTIFLRTALGFAIKNKEFRLGMQVIKSYYTYFTTYLLHFILKDIFCTIPKQDQTTP